MSECAAPLRIFPGIGLEVAKFGEDRTLHRKRLGKFQSFERTPDTGTTDLYLNGLVMLSYNDSDRLNFVEISGNDEVSWGNVRLTGRPIRAVLDDLQSEGIESLFDGDSTYEFSSYGVGFFTSTPEDGTQPVEGISISAPNGG